MLISNALFSDTNEPMSMVVPSLLLFALKDIELDRRRGTQLEVSAGVDSSTLVMVSQKLTWFAAALPVYAGDEKLRTRDRGLRGTAERIDLVGPRTRESESSTTVDEHDDDVTLVLSEGTSGFPDEGDDTTLLIPLKYMVPCWSSICLWWRLGRLSCADFTLSAIMSKSSSVEYKTILLLKEFFSSVIWCFFDRTEPETSMRIGTQIIYFFVERGKGNFFLYMFAWILWQRLDPVGEWRILLLQNEACIHIKYSTRVADTSATFNEFFVCNLLSQFLFTVLNCFTDQHTPLRM